MGRSAYTHSGDPGSGDLCPSSIVIAPLVVWSELPSSVVVPAVRAGLDVGSLGGLGAATAGSVGFLCPGEDLGLTGMSLCALDWS